MAVGDLTASAPVKVDINDSDLIKSTIDALNLATTTDTLQIIQVPNQHFVWIFKVTREA
jgi:hypothetical protein